MRYHLLALILIAGLLFPPGGFAAADNAARPAAEPSSGKSDPKMTAGVVKKVDKPAGKVTISHEPIEHLNMPTKMTMVFRVKDPAMLDQLKEGDRINFVAEKVDGTYTVTSVEPAK
jgi:Cu/Ag efflux protein CusF